jgi:hypothetical protein
MRSKFRNTRRQKTRKSKKNRKSKKIYGGSNSNVKETYGGSNSNVKETYGGVGGNVKETYVEKGKIYIKRPKIKVAPKGYIYAKEVGNDNLPFLIEINTIVMVSNNRFENKDNMTCSVTEDGAQSIEVERDPQDPLILSLEKIKSIISKDGTYLSDNDANKPFMSAFGGKRYKFSCTE